MHGSLWQCGHDGIQHLKDQVHCLLARRSASDSRLNGPGAGLVQMRHSFRMFVCMRRTRVITVDGDEPINLGLGRHNFNGQMTWDHKNHRPDDRQPPCTEPRQDLCARSALHPCPQLCVFAAMRHQQTLAIWGEVAIMSSISR